MTTLLDIVNESFLKYKTSPAVMFDDGINPPVTNTYNQLQQLSSQLCDLLNVCNACDEVVGVCFPPSLYVPVVIIGILKARAAFYNFEASSIEFVSHVVQSLGIRLFLVNSENFQVVEKILTNKVIKHLVLESSDINLIEIQNVQPRKHTQGLAYCITTSGTTGTPKIVRVPHSCILPNITHLRELFSLCSDDLVFMSSPLTFDPSIVDLFLSLASGACLLLVPHVMKMMPRSLISLLVHRHKVTVLQATPTLLSRIGSHTLHNTLLADNSKLRILALGGEKFPSMSVLHQWKSSKNRTRIFNLYGTTEVSCWATFYEVTLKDEGKEDIPLGTPLQDTVVTVLDVYGQEVREGEGHLYISGMNKRLCYLCGENPASITTPPQRATGDWVHIQAGSIVFLHRLDDQVKRNGRRINLSEIEQVVHKMNDVSSCKVLYEKEQLCVFVVSSLTSQTVDTWIHRHLPSHYWPDTVLVVENIPVTKHGKCDTASLMNLVEPGSCSNTNLVKQNISNVEHILQSAWNEVLSSHVVTVAAVNDDDMFLLSGGDSLKAVKFVNIVESRLALHLPDLLDKTLHQKFSEINQYVAITVQELYEELDSAALHKFQNVGDIVDVLGCSEKPKNDDKNSSETTIILNEDNLNMENVERKHFLEDSTVVSTSNMGNFSVLGSEITSNDVTEVNKKQKTFTEDMRLLQAGDAVNENVDIIFSFSRGNKLHVCTNTGAEHETTDMMLMLSSHTAKSEDPECSEMTKSKAGHKAEVSDSKSLSGNTDQLLVCDEDELSIATIDTSKEDIIEPRIHAIKWACDTGKCVDASPLVVKTSASVKVPCQKHLHFQKSRDNKNCLWTDGGKCVMEQARLVFDQSGYHIVYIGSHSHKFVAVVMETGRILWETTLGDRVESSACVSHCGKYVVTGSYDGIVYFLHAWTGKVQWQFQTEGEVKSSPTVDQLTSLVLIGSHDKHLYALDTKKKHCAYRIYLGGGSVFSSPCVSQYPHRVYVSTLSGHVTAVQPYKGDIVWQYKCDKPVFSSPVLTTSGLCVGCVDGTMHHISHAGTLIWKFSTKAPIFSTATVVTCHMKECMGKVFHDVEHIIFGCHDHHLYCLSGHGHLFWKVKVDSPVYATPYCFSLDIPMTSKYNKENTISNAADLYDSHVKPFVIESTKAEVESQTVKCGVILKHGDQNIATLQNCSKLNCGYCIVASTKGYLYVVAVADGRKVSQYTLPGEVFSSPIVCDKRVAIGCRDDCLYCLQL